MNSSRVSFCVVLSIALLARGLPGDASILRLNAAFTDSSTGEAKDGMASRASVVPPRVYVYATKHNPYGGVVQAVNNANIVVGSDRVPHESQGAGFVWDIETDTCKYVTGNAGLLAIDDAGTAVGVNDTGAFRRAPNGTVTPLAPRPDGYVATVIGDMNNDGVIVGALVKDGGHDPFEYQNGQYTVLPGYPGATSTIFHGLNDAGRIVGEYRTGTKVGGFRYDDGAYTEYTAFIPYDINNKDVIVGSKPDPSGRIGQIDEGGTTTEFRFPPWVDGIEYTSVDILHVNDDGVLVGQVKSNALRGFVAKPIGSYTAWDVAKVVRVAVGLTRIEELAMLEARRLNVLWSNASISEDPYYLPRLDLADAVAIARKATGLEANP